MSFEPPKSQRRKREVFMGRAREAATREKTRRSTPAAREQEAERPTAVLVLRATLSLLDSPELSNQLSEEACRTFLYEF